MTLKLTSIGDSVGFVLDLTQYAPDFASQNEVAERLMREDREVLRKTIGQSLDRFVGTWSAEQEAELLKAIEVFERVDGALWSEAPPRHQSIGCAAAIVVHSVSAKEHPTWPYLSSISNA